jgi:hypothetical protein
LLGAGNILTLGALAALIAIGLPQVIKSNNARAREAAANELAA